jgi:hypothetical protein
MAIEMAIADAITADLMIGAPKFLLRHSANVRGSALFPSSA